MRMMASVTSPIFALLEPIQQIARKGHHRPRRHHHLTCKIANSVSRSRPTAPGSWRNGHAALLVAACTPLLLTEQSHLQVHVHMDRLSLSPATLDTSSPVLCKLQQRRRARQTDCIRRANSALSGLVRRSLPSLMAQHFQTLASSRDNM